MPDESHTANAFDGGEELLKGALDSHQTITLKALDVIPHGARLTVYILWTLSLLAGVTGIAFLLAGAQWFAFLIILMAFATIGFSIWLQNKPTKTSPEQLGELARGQVKGPTWARLVPKVPISSSEALDRLQLSIRQLRTTAIAQLNDARKKAGRPAVNAQHIRTNVFLVYTQELAESGALVLVIPKKMHDNMSDFKDRGIRILPHEGLTGRTFTLGEPGGAQATPEGGRLQWSKVDVFPTRPLSDEWERFTLSEEQNALIGTQLRWIVSFPLRYEGHGPEKAFGVLNIDGINDQVPAEDMQSLAASIEPSVNAFAAALAELPNVRITIRVEDVL
jgi:hypothetical protein